MTDDRKAGIALIAGYLGEVVTMAMHPTTSGVVPGPQLEHLAALSGVVHSLAMVSILVLVLGACGLTRRLAAPDRLAFCGLVFFVFASFAILISATVSGFIVPTMMRHMIHDVAAAAPTWRIAIDSVFQFNQAFARLSTVGISIAMVLWGAAALRHRGLSRGIVLYGCILAPVLILAICSGHLTLNVHGAAVVVVAQAVWFIGVGSQLYREEAAG